MIWMRFAEWFPQFSKDDGVSQGHMVQWKEYTPGKRPNLYVTLVKSLPWSGL